MMQDFQSVAKKTLKLLQDRFGFDLWMVARTNGNDWIVLSSQDKSYGIDEGAVLRWHDSICSKMVGGLGTAPKASLAPDHQLSPMGQEINVGSYIGAPLTNENGTLFGTLCAIHPSKTNDNMATVQPIIDMMASLLSAVLAAELKVQDALRRAERAETLATRDSLTGLHNRFGWTQLIAKEEERCRRYGAPACIFNIDLDNLKIINDTEGHAAGDAMIIRAANALLEAARTTDVIARLGGDEFCILGIECDATSAKAIEKRILTCLAAVGVEASIGLAMRCPDQGLLMACTEADKKMYMEKHSKKHAKLARAA